MLYLGLSAIVFVPVFKTITHLPPYVGMMLSLSVVATFAEIFSKAKINITSVDVDNDSHEMHSPVEKSLSKMKEIGKRTTNKDQLFFKFACYEEEQKPDIGT